MDLAPYVESLRAELVAAAEAGGDEARALAERLTGVLDAATRLALLEALSDAATAITSQLAPGSVDVRLRGRDADFVVVPPPDPAETSGDGGDDVTGDADGVTDARDGGGGDVTGDDGAVARITLRLPEHLKGRAEEAAGRAGVSLNAWLVRAVADALDARGGRRPGRPGRTWPGQSYTGWVR